MRVLVISDVSSHMRGGVPAETRTLITGLASRGHTVALASDAPLAGCPQAEHVRIALPVQPSLAAEVAKALEAFKPDFVHVICMNSKGVMLLAALLGTRPWALTVHSIPPYERKLGRWHGSEALHYAARALRFLANSLAWRWVLRRRRVPIVIVHSRFVADIVVGYGSPPGRVKLIPLPFVDTASHGDAPAARRNPDGPRLLTVGGFAHTKGQHDVVKALPALVARFPRLRYQVIGEIRDDSFVAHLRRLADQLGVAGHLLLTPNLSNAERQAALHGADVYVQPSHEEGFCLAYAEAAAAVPRLVGTNTGAIAALSRDDAGARVVPVRDPGAIARAVTELLGIGLPPDHMSARAARLRADFSVERYLESHEAIYAAQ